VLFADVRECTDLSSSRRIGGQVLVRSFEKSNGLFT
jgi:hypothetical protein